MYCHIHLKKSYGHGNSLIMTVRLERTMTATEHLRNKFSFILFASRLPTQNPAIIGTNATAPNDQEYDQ